MSNTLHQTRTSNAVTDVADWDDRMWPNVVAIFDTAGDVARSVKIHATDCRMVNTARKGKGRYVLISECVRDEVADLIERGYGVHMCKCV